jgi:hypothetical protein
VPASRSLPPWKGTEPTRDEDGYAADRPPINDTHVAGERSWNEAATREFGLLLRAALKKGLETPAGVLGYEHRPRPLKFKLRGQWHAERVRPKRVNGDQVLDLKRSIRRK